MRWCAFLFVLFVSGVCAETLMGKVIKIADGDTLTIWTPPIPKIEVSTKAGQLH
jgi:hypothetical protein